MELRKSSLKNKVDSLEEEIYTLKKGREEPKEAWKMPGKWKRTFKKSTVTSRR